MESIAAGRPEPEDAPIGFGVTFIYSMIFRGSQLAQVVTLESGKCIVSWPTSFTVYDSEADARSAHVDENTRFEYVWASSEVARRGATDAYQDRCENSLRDLDEPAWEIPAYLDLEQGSDWRAGYEAMARGLA